MATLTLERQPDKEEQQRSTPPSPRPSAPGQSSLLEEDKLHAICSTTIEESNNTDKNTDPPALDNSVITDNDGTTDCNKSTTINTTAANSHDYCEEEDMKLADSINDLNPELLFDSGIVYLACNEIIHNSKINTSAESVILVPLSAPVQPIVSITPADVLKQHISRTGETVFRDDLISIFVYFIRNLRFSKYASVSFFIDARRLSTDDEKTALDIILGSAYSTYLAFPDNVIDISLLVEEAGDWLTELVENLRRRNVRFGAKLSLATIPHAGEFLFDTDAQAKSRKYFSHWLDFRQVTEQLASLSDNVAYQLNTLMASLTRELPAPVNAELVDRQIEDHQKALKVVFKSDEFNEFEETAESDLQQLREIAVILADQQLDCQYFHRALQSRHKAMQEQLSKVVSLSKMRLNSRLEVKHILLLSAEISQQLSWLNTEACAVLDKLESPILTSKSVDSIVNELADFNSVLVDRLSCGSVIFGKVRETVAFNCQADKKLSPLADLLRIAMDSTRDRFARIEERAAINAEFVCKIDTISDWCFETINFLSTLELPPETATAIFPPGNHPLHLLVQSASRIAQYKLDRPDPIKDSDELFAYLTKLCEEMACDELTRRLHETKSKHDEVLNLFRVKEERLDAALKQLLKLGKPNTGDTSPTSAPRTTMAQLRLQRRILRSVSLLEQGADVNLTATSIAESSTETPSEEQDTKVPNGSAAAENCPLRYRSATQPPYNNNRRSVAVLKALEEINEHLLDFERSNNNNNNNGYTSQLPPSMYRVSRQFENNNFVSSSAIDSVVMRRRPSAGPSSSSSSASCSTCRQSSHLQSGITASPSHYSNNRNVIVNHKSAVETSNNDANRRYSCEIRNPLSLNKPGILHQQLLMMQSSGLNGNHQCLLPMSAKDEQIVGELLQTENDYIASLKYVIDNYLEPLTQDNRPHPLQGKLNIVFGNIESLLDFHETLLLPELELCRHNLFMLATCFLRAEQELASLYVYYNTNKSRSDRLLNENANLFSTIQSRLGHKLDVGSYLLKPVQRLAKYSQFLRQLLVGRASNDAAHGQLMLAERMLSYILRHGNDLLLLEQLRGYDFALAEQGQLLRQDKMFVERKGKSRKLRHLFLFEEILVMSKIHKGTARNDYFEYKESVKICDIGLTPSVGRSGTKFEVWFRRPNSGYRYVIKAENPTLRLAWTTDIEELLWRQAVAVKERRAAQFVSMGIGLRGLINLQPSLHNINSRTVSIASPASSSQDSTGRKDLLHRRPASVMVLTASESENSSTTNNEAQINQNSRLPQNLNVNKRPYSWLSSASSGTQSSSANNTPAPTTTAISNSNYSAVDVLKSPLLSIASNERLLIPKLGTIGDTEELFDFQGQFSKGYTRTIDAFNAILNSDDENNSSDSNMATADDVQRVDLTKSNEMEIGFENNQAVPNNESTLVE